MCDSPAGGEMTRPDVAAADRPHLLLYLIAAAAILFGLWGRFKGLGAWPLSDDEYYTARSVEDILRIGTPEYDCGGWYLRGLPYMYLVALVQMAGLGPELSLRVVTAISSLLVLPAAYVLGKRAQGRTAGLLVVTILAASVWEIELARFGRMYAPFQAIFTWYLVYFVRYVVDQDRRAIWPMLGLSILGAMVWEGGLFLIALNALPPFFGNAASRLRLRDIVFILFMGVLLVAGHTLMSGVFRYASEVPAFPEGYDLDSAMQSAGPVTGWRQTAQGLLAHPGWSLVMAAPVVTALAALPWIWRLRQRWLAAAGAALVLLLALVHQFAAAASVLLLMLLARVLKPVDLRTRGASTYFGAILASLVAWACLGLFSDLWMPADASTWLGEGRRYLLLQEFFGRPDILLQVVRPWIGAASLYGLALLIALVIAVRNDLRSPSPYSAAFSVLLLVVILMLMAVGLSDPPRQETRYIFFLYPAVVVVATVVLLASRPLRGLASLAAVAAPLIVLSGFALLEDFRPAHILAIDSAAVNFRIGLGGRAARHVIARTDPRGAAQWVDAHADRPDDLRVNGFPAASFYSGRFNFAYTDMANQRYRAFACARGTTERWSNLPLLSSLEALAVEVRQHGRTFFVADRWQESQLLNEMASYQPTVVWRSIDGHVSVVRLTPGQSVD